MLSPFLLPVTRESLLESMVIRAQYVVVHWESFGNVVRELNRLTKMAEMLE